MENKGHQQLGVGPVGAGRRQQNPRAVNTIAKPLILVFGVACAELEMRLEVRGEDAFLQVLESGDQVQALAAPLWPQDIDDMTGHSLQVGGKFRMASGTKPDAGRVEALGAELLVAVSQLGRPGVWKLGDDYRAQYLVDAQEKVAELLVSLHALLVHTPVVGLVEVEIFETRQAGLIHGENIGFFALCVFLSWSGKAARLIHSLLDVWQSCRRSAGLPAGRGSSSSCVPQVRKPAIRKPRKSALQKGCEISRQERSGFAA